MSFFFKFFLFIIFTPVFATNYSIVFVHIGKNLPNYLETSIKQARLFNPECEIVLIANKDALCSFSCNENITCIACEALKKTNEHILFTKKSKMNGFWLYTSERFLYIYDYMIQYNKKNIFHLENDNMLYVNLEELFPIFEKKYPGLGITMDNDYRCIPGFVYIADQNILHKLANFFINMTKNGKNDMEILGYFKYEADVVNLPIIMKEYIENEELKTPSGLTSMNPFEYCQNIDLFESIFDAAAIGQYLGGIDPIHGLSKKGFINESCLFNPSKLSFEWIIDEHLRNVPYAIYKNKKFRINNLHIHSKNLKEFVS